MITRATIEGSDKFGTSQNGAKYRIKILQKRKAFISRWTTNVGSGGSNTDQVQLPLINGKTYNMVVDWGDGTSDTITSYNHAEPNTPNTCLLYTSPSPRDRTRSRMPSSA